MKKLSFAGLSLMLLVLLTGVLLEAEDPEWSGEIDLPYAYRSGELTTTLDSGDTEMDAILTPLITLNVEWALTDRSSEFTGVLAGDNTVEFDTVLAPLITLNMEWALIDKVSTFIQIENRRVQYGTFPDDFAEFAGGEGIKPAFEQAYIKIEKFLTEKLICTFGIQDLKLTLREGEGAFFIDVAGSNEKGFLETIVGGGNPVERDVREFGGFTFNYGNLTDDNYEVLVFWGGVSETRTAATSDEKLMGINLAYKLPGKDNVLKTLLANFVDTAKGMNLCTIGVGVDYFGAAENLELYGEIYVQTGEIITDIDLKAQAFRLGGRYNFRHKLNPYIDLSYWMLSGGNFADPSTDEVNHFVSLENVQSTLILEDNLFGLDLDSNYTAIKVEAGIETSLDINGDGTPEPVSLKLLLGQFTLTDKTVLEPNFYVDDALGTEIDITATLHYTESLSFTLAIGMLSGADFFTQFQPDTDAMSFVSFGTRINF